MVSRRGRDCGPTPQRLATLRAERETLSLNIQARGSVFLKMEPRKMAETPFELDENGMIVTRPLLGFTIVPVAGMSILTRLEYAEKAYISASGWINIL